MVQNALICINYARFQVPGSGSCIVVLLYCFLVVALLFGTIEVAPQLLTHCACSVTSGGNSLFRWWGGGAKPPKFPTKLSNFRQPPPPFALEKAVFSPLLGQNFRKFVIFREGGGGGGGRPPAPPRFPPLSVTSLLRLVSQSLLAE